MAYCGGARRNITGTSGGHRGHLCNCSPSALSNLDVRYRYQLEAFVEKVRGRKPEHWYDAQDSIANMEWIEAVYGEVSRFFLPGQRVIRLTFFRLGWDPDLGRRLRCRRNFIFSHTKFVDYVM